MTDHSLIRNETNYPAASYGVSETTEQRKNLIGASSGASTRGAMDSVPGLVWRYS
jgi:hypothetical protein